MTLTTSTEQKTSMAPSSNKTILLVGNLVLGPRKVAGLLADKGYSVQVVASPLEAIRHANFGWVSLVIVDESLLGSDPQGLLSRLSRDLAMPVILLGQSNNETTAINALEYGADDYISPSMAPHMFLARIKSVLRRVERTAAIRYLSDSPKLVFDGWTMDLERRTVIHEDGRDPDLSDSEFRLLRVLAEHPNQVLSREEILTRTHARQGTATVRSVDIQVTRLRRKIEEDVSRPRLIRTVRHEGYMLAAVVIAKPT